MIAWKTSDTTQLFKAILALKTISESEDFFRDLLTLSELKEISKRLKVAKLLSGSKGKKTYVQIAKEARTTTATVTRVAHWLKNGTGGYRMILDRLK